MASDAMRAAIERHYDVRLAFQNCHRAAVFRPGAAEALAEFTSARSQLLNQRPEMVDCLKADIRTGAGDLSHARRCTRASAARRVKTVVGTVAQTVQPRGTAGAAPHASATALTSSSPRPDTSSVAACLTTGEDG